MLLASKLQATKTIHNQYGSTPPFSYCKKKWAPYFLEISYAVSGCVLRGFWQRINGWFNFKLAEKNNEYDWL
jgi:hypothetical protein